MNLLICAAANNFAFIDDIGKALDETDGLAVKFCSPTGPYFQDFVWADVVWFEWFDGIVCDFLKSAELKKRCNIKYIVRLHRYEVFTQRTIDQLRMITNDRAYKNIDQLVFVSEMVREIGSDLFPWMKDSVVVPNLFNSDRFPFRERAPGKNILFLGRKTYVKNIPLLLSCFYELLKCPGGREYTLSLVGKNHDTEITRYITDFVAKAWMSEHVKIYDAIPHGDVPEFMADMNFIACTSIFESQGMGIIEGMSTGLTPVVFDFPGARSIFPIHCLFLTPKWFCDRIQNTSRRPMEYREYVLSKYSIKLNLFKYYEMIKGVADAK